MPAPLWRRLAAAIYDSLLLAALAMIATLADAVIRSALGLPFHPGVLRGALFLVGFLFFGWFWTHGGQTLGMRAWRLRVQRADGGALGWTQASLRYAVGWLSLLFLGMGMLWCLLDGRRRAWHDMAAGTEVLLLPAVLRAPEGAPTDGA